MQMPDGRSKGCGIVEFSTRGRGAGCLTLNDTELYGRQIFVREDREDSRHPAVVHLSPRRQQRRTVVVVPNSAGEQMSPCIRWKSELGCSVAGPEGSHAPGWRVLHAEVIMELNGRSKGCGIVVCHG
jgi:hypothetical protein